MAVAVALAVEVVVITSPPRSDQGGLAKETPHKKPGVLGKKKSPSSQVPMVLSP